MSEKIKNVKGNSVDPNTTARFTSMLFANLYEPTHDKTYKMAFAPSGDSDQPNSCILSTVVHVRRC